MKRGSRNLLDAMTNRNQEQRKLWISTKQLFNRIRRLILLQNQFCLEPMSNFHANFRYAVYNQWLWMWFARTHVPGRWWRLFTIRWGLGSNGAHSVFDSWHDRWADFHANYRSAFIWLTSKRSEYAPRTLSSDLAVFVNFYMLITNIIRIFPNLACVSSTSALSLNLLSDYEARVAQHLNLNSRVIRFYSARLIL